MKSGVSLERSNGIRYRYQDCNRGKSDIFLRNYNCDSDSNTDTDEVIAFR